MAFPASSFTSLPEALAAMRAITQGVKAQAGNALTFMQTSNIDTVFVYTFLDRMLGIINALNTWKSTAGLNAYATANIPGYAGTLTSDIDAVITAGQSCIDWIVQNFPKDTTNTYILAEILNADGTRQPRQFTPAMTAGLQTRVQAFIATIG